MTRVVSWLAVLYVLLLPLGRSGLPLNAQWGDLLLPFLAVAVWRATPQGTWVKREDWPLALYLLVTLATAAVSPEPRIGFAHLVKQLYVASVFIVFRRSLQDATSVGLLQRTYVTVFAGVTLLSIWVVLLRVPAFVPASFLGAADTLPFLGMVPRLRGAWLTPEMLGNGLVLAFVLALAFRESSHGRGRVFWAGTAMLLVVGEFFTFSHSVAGFAVAAALFLTFSIQRRSFRFAVWAGAFTVVAAVNGASLVEPGPARNDHGVGPVTVELPGGRLEGELNHYAALKLVAWSTFTEKPWTGVGPGRFPSATERAFQDGRLTARYRNKPAQSDLIGRLAETGLVGGISLVLLWGAWLRPALSGQAMMHPAQRAAFAALLGLLVNSLNADVMNFRFLWLAVAWVGTLSSERAADQRTA